MTLLRLEGIAASVAASRQLRSATTLAPFGAAEIAAGCRLGGDLELRSATSCRLRRGGALGAWPVWRIVCPPASGGALGQALARDTGGEVIYDWGGGLIWAALPPKRGCACGAGARSASMPPAAMPR